MKQKFELVIVNQMDRAYEADVETTIFDCLLDAQEAMEERMKEIQSGEYSDEVEEYKAWGVTGQMSEDKMSYSIKNPEQGGYANAHIKKIMIH